MSYALRFARDSYDSAADYYDWYFTCFPGRDSTSANREIEQSFTSILANPYIKQIDQLPIELGHPIRHVTVWKFNFFYVIIDKEKTVEVIAVVHQAAGSQKLSSALRV